MQICQLNCQLQTGYMALLVPYCSYVNTILYYSFNFVFLKNKQYE
jgi:hypothetical protein